MASRRPWTYWSRLLIAAIATVLTAMVGFTISNNTSGSMVGRQLFYIIGSFAFIQCLLTGFTSADSLSWEKRNGTLGLLFLTDLRSSDIVLGKVAAHSLIAVYSVVAVLPVLALPMLMGGVSMGVWACLILVLLNTIWFSIAVSMLVSSLVRSPWKAWGWTFAIIGFLTLAVPLWAFQAFRSGWERELLLQFSPLLSLELVLNNNTLGGRTLMGTNYLRNNMLTVHAMGWAAFLLAIVFARKHWQDPVIEKSKSAKAAVDSAYLSRKEKRRARRYDLNAFYGLLTRHRWKPFWVWVVLAGLCFLWFMNAVAERGWRQDEEKFVFCALSLHAVLKCWIGAEASNRIAQDRSSGALELMLCTPLKPIRIFDGQMRALLWQFGLPVVFIILVDIGLVTIWVKSGSNKDMKAGLFLAGITTLLIDCVALYWTATWLAVKSGSLAKTLVGLIARFFFLPWFGFVMMIVVRTSRPGQAVFGQVTEEQVLGGWWLISVSLAIFFGVRSRKRCFWLFRLAASGENLYRARGWSRKFLEARQ